MKKNFHGLSFFTVVFCIVVSVILLLLSIFISYDFFSLDTFHSIDYWLERYQSLLSAILAFVVGWLGYKILQAQFEMQKDQSKLEVVKVSSSIQSLIKIYVKDVESRLKRVDDVLKNNLSDIDVDRLVNSLRRGKIYLWLPSGFELRQNVFIGLENVRMKELFILSHHMHDFYINRIVFSSEYQNIKPAEFLQHMARELAKCYMMMNIIQQNMDDINNNPDADICFYKDLVTSSLFIGYVDEKHQERLINHFREIFPDMKIQEGVHL